MRDDRATNGTLRVPDPTSGTPGDTPKRSAQREFIRAGPHRGNFRWIPCDCCRLATPGEPSLRASGASAVDQRLFLDVNRFAARTAWAHGVAAFLARPWALAILALLVLVAMLRARAAGLGGSDLDQIAALIWVVVGAGLALAVSLPIVHLVARERPFVAMPSVVVLVPRPTGFSFPNEHAVIAGAVAAGLWLSRSYLIAALATLYAAARLLRRRLRRDGLPRRRPGRSAPGSGRQPGALPLRHRVLS